MKAGRGNRGTRPDSAGTRQRDRERCQEGAGAGQKPRKEAEEDATFCFPSTDRALYHHSSRLHLFDTNRRLELPRPVATNFSSSLLDISFLRFPPRLRRLTRCLSALGCAALNKTEVADTDGRLQVESTRIQGQAIASYLKFKIMSGWDDFASVHHIALQGRPK